MKRLRYLFAAGLLAVPGVCASSVAAADDLEAAGIEFQRIEEIHKLPEFVWLEGGAEALTSMTVGGGEVYFAGFYPESEITPELLARFERNPLFPNWPLEDLKGLSIGKVRIFWFPAQDGSGARCGALVQIVRDTADPPTDANVDAELERLRNFLPDKPLTGECRAGEPPALPTGFLDRFAARDGFLLEEQARPCSSFKEGSTGIVKLSPQTKIDYRRVLTDPVTSKDTDRIAFQTFGSFIRFFNASLDKRKRLQMQVLTWGNYLPDEDDVTLTVRAVEDRAEDTICFVADFEQGPASRRFVFSERRNGLPLPWNRTRNDGSEYFPPTALRALGERAASTLSP